MKKTIKEKNQIPIGANAIITNNKAEHRIKELLKSTGLKDEQLRLPGFPIIPIGDQIIVKAIEQSSLVHSSSGLLLIEGKDNESKTCEVMAISPELFNKLRYPMFNLKPGDMCFFNHLVGNYMRLAFKQKLGEFFVMYYQNLFGLFTGDQDEYFGKQITNLPTTADGVNALMSSSTGSQSITGIN